VYAARSLFVAGLLVGLAAVWWQNVAGQSLDSIREQAEAGRRFYQALASMQLALALAAGMLLLSISAASALAEERVHGNLDVLLATPLSTRSIAWGKWWATFRAVPVLAVPPGLAATAVAWHHGHWLGVVLVVGLVLQGDCAILGNLR
jgi:ABC-type Na+ efflux pump permease subunit